MADVEGGTPAPGRAEAPERPDPAHLAKAEQDARDVVALGGLGALGHRSTKALLAEYDRRGAEVERLRGRTHEIQAQEMAKRSAMDSELAEWRNRWLAAKTWSEHTGLTADWAVDPTLPFWSMTSEATRCALMALVAQRDEARAEAERLSAQRDAALALTKEWAVQAAQLDRLAPVTESVANAARAVRAGALASCAHEARKALGETTDAAGDR